MVYKFTSQGFAYRPPDLLVPTPRSSIMSILLAAAVTLLFTVTAQVFLRRSKGRHLPVPPGPPSRWLVGNLLDIPSRAPWKTYRDWCHKYGEYGCPVNGTMLISRLPGDVVYLDLPVKPLLVLGSVKAANELLDARSNIYSDRPKIVMTDLCVHSTAMWAHWLISSLPSLYF